MEKTKQLWKVVAVNIKSGKMEEVKFTDDSNDSCVKDIIDGLEYAAIDEFDGKLIDGKYWSCSKRLGDEWLIDASKEYCEENGDDYYIYDWNTAKLVPANADVADVKAPKTSAELKKVRALKNKMQALFDEMAELACDLGYGHLADALDWSCGRDADVIREDFSILEKAVSSNSDNKKGSK